jgi:hypothetical protein
VTPLHTYGCVWVCVCLGLYAVLEFPRFLCAVKCAVAGSLIAPVSDLLQGFMCVCAQVSCSVVSNCPLCEFCGRVYCDILSIFLIPQFCLFLRHQTMD